MIIFKKPSKQLLTRSWIRSYSLRVTEPKICHPSVKQYSGYLGIVTGRHLFFWFFESRIAPSKAPIILWISGGSGCSSTFGLLFELGPCGISNEGKSTSLNPYSWNEHADIISGPAHQYWFLLC
ncbi:serine carboxypeptidase-domain-containing protein [Panaeolus papilionaceus]|nr:serine carboxypeptidase-domain-containing protein [Panaeolus papilionaceus]